MSTFKIFNYIGCGGCNLEIMNMQAKLLQLFRIADYSESKSEVDKVDLGIVTGKINDGNRMDLEGQCQSIILVGTCAISSYEDLVSPAESPSSSNFYRVRGCPLSTKELIYVIHSLLSGVVPKDKTYPVCMECKVKENPCLLLQGMPCLGPVTIAGCDAKCPSAGTPCRGCRGFVKNARFDLLDEASQKKAASSVWHKNTQV